MSDAPFKHRCQSLKKIVNDNNSVLHQLRRQADNLQQLQQHIMALLPESIATHCQVTQWQQGELVISVDNAAYITQLRYHNIALRDALRKLPVFAQLSHIKFNVVPNLFDTAQPQQPTTITTHKKQSLSAQTVSLIEASADQFKQNPKMARLYTALTKLAKQ